jgi:hypothetical protein
MRVADHQLKRLKTAGFLILIGAVTGCASGGEMDLYVPHACHGAAEPFSTYSLSFVEVPGFIEGVIETAAEGALAAQGLDEAPSPGEADVAVINSFYLIDRNPPPPEMDPMGEPVQTGTTNRFVTHLKVDVLDQRTDKIIWTGAMYRSHAIQGGETFHDDRAVLMIRQAYDDMFVGLTAACE